MTQQIVARGCKTHLCCARFWELHNVAEQTLPATIREGKILPESCTICRTGDGQVAEDTASEVVLRALDAFQNGQAPRQTLHGWLFGTASRNVNYHLHRRYRTKDDNLANQKSLSASTETNPAHQLQRNLSQEQLRTALMQLTPEQQHVIGLRFGQGLLHRQVA